MAVASRLRTPVALVIFNRPEATARVLEAIAVARPPRLYVIADGPRPDHPDDERLVAETRAVIKGVDWPCEVHTRYAEHNLGCGRRVATGLDWLFANEPEAIVLEDDTLPDPTFFEYCDELLERYRHDERVHMISGSTPVADGDASCSYRFSNCYAIWGWASWARAWEHYDFTMRAWHDARDTRWLQGHLGDTDAVMQARAWFDASYADPAEQWDFQWLFSGWLRNAVAASPSVNLVTNIGFGAAATHLREGDHPFASMPAASMEFPLRHPGRVEVDRRAEQAMWDAVITGLHGSRAELRRLVKGPVGARGRRVLAQTRRALAGKRASSGGGRPDQQVR